MLIRSLSSFGYAVDIEVDAEQCWRGRFVSHGERGFSLVRDVNVIRLTVEEEHSGRGSWRCHQSPDTFQSFGMSASWRVFAGCLCKTSIARWTLLAFFG